MIELFRTSIVRIFTEDKQSVVGSGFLLSATEVLTCAHVAAQALNIALDTTNIPERPLYLDFYGALEEKCTARIVEWYPQSEKDIALLQLDISCPQIVSPTQLIMPDDMWGDPFRAFGFPDGHTTGVWADGRILDRDNRGFVQIEGVTTTGHRIEQGFSGTPVWDDKAGGVVGMVVETDRQGHTKTAFMIPTELLVKTCSRLDPYVMRNEGTSKVETTDIDYAPLSLRAIRLISSRKAVLHLLPYCLTAVSCLASLLLVLQYFHLLYPVPPLAFVDSFIIDPYHSIALCILAALSEVLLLHPMLPEKAGKFEWRMLLGMPRITAITSILNIVTLTVVLFVLIQPAVASNAVGIDTNQQDDSPLEIKLIRTSSDWWRIPNLQQNYSLTKLPKDVAVVHTFDSKHMRDDPRLRPAYHIILSVYNKGTGPDPLTISRDEVTIEVKQTSSVPHPLNIWETGGQDSYLPAPLFVATHEIQQRGGDILAYPQDPSTYVPLFPGPSDTLDIASRSATLDIAVCSATSIEMDFQLRLTYNTHGHSSSLTYTTIFHVIFSDDTNWHPYLFKNGKFVPDDGAKR